MLKLASPTNKRLTVLLPSKKSAYRWQGVDQHGHTIQGNSSACNKNEVRNELFKKGIYLLSITKHKKRDPLTRIKLSLSQWLNLLDQWQYGLQSHLSINQTLELLQGSGNDKALRLINQYCYQQTLQGVCLSKALSNYSNFGPGWIINTLAAGEQYGDLSRILSHLQTCLKQQQQLKQHIKKALVYPGLVISLTVAITLFMLLVIIPQFRELYQQLNTELPWVTQWLLSLSSRLHTHGLTISLNCAGIFVIGLLVHHHSSSSRLFIHRAALRIPKIAGFIQHQQLARWYGILSLLHNAGLAIDTSLQHSNACFQNTAFKQFGHELVDNVKKGQMMQETCSSSHLLPNLDKQLLAIGENTGQISQVCQHLSDHHQQHLLRLAQHIAQWLEPSIMILLAVIIGGLVMAMYAPIFNLGNVL